MDAWAFFRTKDKLMRSVFDSYLSVCSPDNICDIGCFNADEIVRFKQLSPNSSFYAFEANEANLRQFILSRSDIDGISFEHIAIADRDGETTFYRLVAEEFAHDWRRAAGSLFERSDGLPAEAVTVPCTKLDTYFRDAIDRQETFALWIDVEGALFQVIQGAPEIMKRTIILRAEVERHQFWKGQRLVDEDIAAIEGHGFVLIGDSYTADAHPQSDVLFLNKNWLELAANSTRRDK